MPLCFVSLRLRAFHPLRGRFPAASAREISCNVAVLLPRRRLDDAGLGCSAFARHYSRNHCYFLLLWVLRCFSSPRSPPLRDGGTGPPGCPIRKSGDPGIFAPPPRLSQLITSFLASESQGIHRLPLLTFARRAIKARVDIPLSSLFSFQSIFLDVHHVKDHTRCVPVVENNGFEPLTPCLQSRCSSQLS